jgi:SNF2 family DNA or RNA helicase
VVCPASLTLHWKQEIMKFFPLLGLDPSCLDVYSSPLLIPSLYESNLKIDCACQNDSNLIVIASYDAVRRDRNDYFTGQVWSAVVLDEAHGIKNPLSATSRSIFKIRSQCRIALSGTPIQNQVDDLWSIMQFLVPDYLGDYDTFKDRVVKPVTKSFAERKKLHLYQNRKHLEQKESLGNTDESIADINTVLTPISIPIPAPIPTPIPTTVTEGSTPALEIKGDGDSMSFSRFQSAIEISAEGLAVLKKLHEQVLPFILRRTKGSVASELPAKAIIDISCPLSIVQKKMYSDFQKGLSLSDVDLETVLRRIKEGGQVPCDGIEKSSAPLGLQGEVYERLIVFLYLYINVYAYIDRCLYICTYLHICKYIQGQRRWHQYIHSKLYCILSYFACIHAW